MKKIITGLFVLLLSACSSQTILISEKNSNNFASYEKTKHFIIGGFKQFQKVNAIEICGLDNVAKVQFMQSFPEWLVSYISYNVYSPYSMNIYCKQEA